MPLLTTSAFYPLSLFFSFSSSPIFITLSLDWALNGWPSFNPHFYLIHFLTLTLLHICVHLFSSPVCCLFIPALSGGLSALLLPLRIPPPLCLRLTNSLTSKVFRCVFAVLWFCMIAVGMVWLLVIEIMLIWQNPSLPMEFCFLESLWVTDPQTPPFCLVCQPLEFPRRALHSSIHIFSPSYV